MRRLPSSYSKHKISDAEIDDLIYGAIQPSAEIPMQPRDHGERVLYVGFTTARVSLVEIGIEDQHGELVVFHAREATAAAVQAFKMGR